MKKVISLLLIALVIITSCKDNTSTEFENHTKDNYSISYPSEWKLDISGKYNTEFLIFSEMGVTDSFGENVNLTIQNLQSQDMTLSQFAEMTEKQLAPVPKSEIIKSEVQQKNGLEFYEIEWKGYVTNNDLHFKQYYFVKDNKSYIVTFTTLQDTYDEYETIATKILDSFTFI